MIWGYPYFWKHPYINILPCVFLGAKPAPHLWFAGLPQKIPKKTNGWNPWKILVSGWFLGSNRLPSGKTNIAGWKIIIFNRKYIFNPGPFSTVMLVYRSVVFGGLNGYFRIQLSMPIFFKYTLPETNSKFAPENRPRAPKGKEKVFQTSIFWCFLLLVSGRVKQRIETNTT